MKTNLLFITALFVTSSIIGQTEFNHLYSAYSGLNSEPVIFNDVNLNSYEAISTALQYSKKDDLQKVVLVPFKFFKSSNSELNYNFIHETKINLAQKNGISTIGIGFAFDEAAPAGKIGVKLFKSDIEINEKLRKWLINFPLLHKSDIDQLLKQKDSLNLFIAEYNKIVPIKPLRVFPDTPSYEKYIEIERPDAIKIIFEKMHANLITSLEDYNEFRDSEYNLVNTRYYEKLVNNRWKVTLGGNVSLFELLAGTKTDVDSNRLIDNYFQTKQLDVSIGVTRSFAHNAGFSVTGHYTTKRSSSEEKQRLVPYAGFSISTGWIIKLLNKDYKTSEDYIKNLFIPSIVMGLSIEYQKCIYDILTPPTDNIDRTIAYSVFWEFRIKPQNQFKITIPLKKIYNIVDTENPLTTGPILEYRLQLSGG